MSRSRARTPKNLTKWYIEYSIYRSVEFLFSLVPLKSVCELGKDVGRLAFHLTKKYRKLVYKNLCIVSPSISEKERWELTKTVFERNGANLFASIKTATMSKENIEECVQIENQELLENTNSSEGGIVLLLAHMGNWELLSQLPFLINTQCQFGTFYRPLNNPFVNTLIERRRQRMGVKLFAKQSSLLKISQYLKEGNVVGILADQRVGKSGEHIHFFGTKTNCTSLPYLLAKRSNSEVLALSMKTISSGKWSICFHKPSDSEYTTVHLMETLETAMKQSIVDCFWFQDRWRKAK